MAIPQHSADRNRPTRSELFAFYYLGFNPEGEYRFPNAHHVGRHFNVSSDAVFRWLTELDLEPHWAVHQQFNLARAQVDLQLEAENLTPPQIMVRTDEILAALDEARGGRKPWEDEEGTV